jgi:hypothetical protein
MPETNFRALCAELAEELVNEYGYCTEWEKGLPLCESNVSELLTRARAALDAQPEPAPTDEDLYELWEREGYEGDFQDCRRFYRGAIARWGRPTPQPPADGEVAELVAWLRATGKLLHPDYSKSRIPYMRAAALLERLASDNAGLAAAADSLYADNMSLLDNHND